MVNKIHCKTFNDGVNMVVYCTFDHSEIIRIDSVDVTFNSHTSGIAFNCEYASFLLGSWSVVVGGKQVNMVPRVRAVIEGADESMSYQLNEPARFPRTQSKVFDDGLSVLVSYTTNNLENIHIDFVNITFNSHTKGIEFDCEYTQFLNGFWSFVVGGKQVNIVPLVRAVIEEVDLDRTSVTLDEHWTHVAETSEGNLYINGNVAPDSVPVFDGDDYVTLPVGERSSTIMVMDDEGRIVSGRPVVPGVMPTKPPAPKRKRTRWELLELD